MTNEQIIEEIAKQIYGEEAVMQMIDEGIEIPLHTVQGWNLRGKYKVKKGEHGIETRLWRKRKKKKAEPEDDEKADSNTSDPDQKKDFYMCKAFLFRADQVELIKK